MNYTSIKANEHSFQIFQRKLIELAYTNLNKSENKVLTKTLDEVIDFAIKHRLVSIELDNGDKQVADLILTECWVDEDVDKYEELINSEYDTIVFKFEVNPEPQYRMMIMSYVDKPDNGSDNDIDKNHTTVVESDLSNTFDNTIITL